MSRACGIAAMVLAAAGCGAVLAARPERPTPSASPEPAATAVPSVSFREHLRHYAIHHGDVARRELYTWTRLDQVEQLRRDRRLLIRYRGARGQLAAFDHRLQRREGDPIAELLTSDAMKYRRFAWVSAWPTRRGWGERDYGDQLIRVTLADEAWIGVLDSHDRDGWRFVDLEGDDVSTDQILAAPQRLGAVYHVWHHDDGADLGGVPHVFREYVLCNEAMIERWEIGSDAIVERVARDRAALSALANDLRRRGIAEAGPLSSWAKRVEDSWLRPPADDPLTLYETNLALLGAPYLPSAENVATIEAALAHSKTPGPPLVVMRQPAR